MKLRRRLLGVEEDGERRQAAEAVEGGRHVPSSGVADLSWLDVRQRWRWRGAGLGGVSDTGESAEWIGRSEG